MTFEKGLDRVQRMHIINDCCPRNEGNEKKRTLTIEKQQK